MAEHDNLTSKWGMGADAARKKCEHLRREEATERFTVRSGDATIVKHRVHEVCSDCGATLRLISSEPESESIEPPASS
ncbi:MAG: hypothetical protein H0U66_00600 [Gemmatimonadaceae bacterium]|nr:hypothetical protein [Gemmatimonadaceae bacterium]